ncbi:MAG TPA: hypothetical protein VF173_20360 [Thermoanaerobaculia bacterium]|nr:hypothetical protein [Thermoanaerobaculia bacterium]
MNRTLPASIILVTCAFLASAAQAQPTASLCAGGGSTASLATTAPDGASPSLGELLLGPAAHGVVYLQGGSCMVTNTCPDGSTISCTGLQCATTTSSCPGSTCPGQQSNTHAVQCDGVVRASCPCDVCFGCGASCTTNANCATVCTCGHGRCSAGHCVCAF